MHVMIRWRPSAMGALLKVRGPFVERQIRKGRAGTALRGFLILHYFRIEARPHESEQALLSATRCAIRPINLSGLN
jgi:hypothetical protein